MEVIPIAQIFLLMGSLWFFGLLFDLLYIGLIGEILVGIILGPPVLNIVPFASSLEIFAAIGLMFLVFESGISMNLNSAKSDIARSFIIAIVGTLLPILFGWGLLQALGYSSTESLASGVSISATSIGMATRMLTQRGMLGSRLGQLISLAAMVDDVVSLVVLAMFETIVKSRDGNGTNPINGNGNAWAIARPLVASIGCILVGIFITFLIPVIRRTLSRRLVRDPSNFLKEFIQSRLQLHPPLLFFAFSISLIPLSALLADLSGTTPLLGPFVTGLIFSKSKTVHTLLSKYYISILWVQRLFFASIGFAVPIDVMFIPTIVGYGLLYSLVGALGKLLVFPLVFPFRLSRVSKQSWNEAMQVGTAMIARGELGFLIAKSAMNGGLMSREVFSITVWALFVDTIIAPVLFALTLGKRNTEETAALEWNC
ncbi:Cation/H+ exchanger [Paraphysoderma sedebokerense]|nr:Cation/H+ exchanger [Paraphysoderma sedebokerense]